MSEQDWYEWTSYWWHKLLIEIIEENEMRQNKNEKK